MGSVAWQTQLLLAGGGILAILYAKKKGIFPFNKDGPFDTLSDTLTDDSTDDSVDNKPTKPSLGPAGNTFQMGNGFNMNVPPGGVNTPLVLSPQQQAQANRQYPYGGGTAGVSGPQQVSGPPNPFMSTVANDPTPTDYGVYTQYLQGIRNEYGNMQNAIAAQQQQQMGVGGDITTIPQPPQVGAVPYGSNGMGPPVFPGVGVPPPPLPYGFPRQPPIYMLPPPPRGWRRMRPRRTGYLIDISPTGGIRLPGINIGPNGIDIMGLIKIGGGPNGLFGDILGGGQGSLIDVNLGGDSQGSGGGLLGGNNNGGQSGGLLGGIFGQGGLLGNLFGGGGGGSSGSSTPTPTGGNDNYGGFLGGLLNNIDLSKISNGGISSAGTINYNGQNMTPSQFQQMLQSQIQNNVKQGLSNSGLNVSFAATDVTGQGQIIGQARAEYENAKNQAKMLARKKNIKGLTRAEFEHHKNMLKKMNKLTPVIAQPDKILPKNAATFIEYAEDAPVQTPADFNGIKPTLMNMVSRNQSMGIMGHKLGNL